MTAPAVAQRLAALRAAGGRDGTATCRAVRDVVVVCSSSRGGSSLFGELLRRSPDLLTFSAEINPHVTIPTLGSGGGADVVADPAPYAGEGVGLAVLQRELGNDLGRPAMSLDRAEFVRHVAWRLTMQWPSIAFDPDRVELQVEQALAVTTAGQTPPDRGAFTLALLGAVIRDHPAVNPYRYDLPAADVAAAFPDAVVPSGPTDEPVVEMAPFVLPRAWQVAAPSEAARLAVVATTPRNAFRLPLLARAFPNARIRVLHLTRNPAAAVNGLRDGWLHRGFFSCRTEVPLRIAGYSDVAPAWGGEWWNYDVPPGWRQWTDRSLPEVCGFQWRAAHEATVESIAGMGLDSHRVAFEDVVDRRRRRETMTAVCRWIGIDPQPILQVPGDLPVVMPTAAPRPRRWQDNAAVLGPVLADAQVIDTARMLGYGADPAGWS